MYTYNRERLVNYRDGTNYVEKWKKGCVVGWGRLWWAVSRAERMVGRGAGATWSLHRRERGVIAAPLPAWHAVPRRCKATDASPFGEAPAATLCLERARPLWAPPCRSLTQRSHASTQTPDPPVRVTGTDAPGMKITRFHVSIYMAQFIYTLSYVG